MSGYVAPVYQNAINNAIQENNARLAAQQAAEGRDGSGSGSGNLATIFKPKTAPYDPNAKVYSNMPTGVQFPAFMPGQQSAIASQLAQGYGAPASDYMGQMNSVYAPMNTTRLFEPITQTARAWGLKPTGQPGGWKAMEKDGKKGGFNPQGYQQWGQDTYSPLLNRIFGLKNNIPTPEEIAAEKAAAAAKKKKKNNNNDGRASAPVSMAPTNQFTAIDGGMFTPTRGGW